MRKREDPNPSASSSRAVGGQLLPRRTDGSRSDTIPRSCQAGGLGVVPWFAGSLCSPSLYPEPSQAGSTPDRRGRNTRHKEEEVPLDTLIRLARGRDLPFQATAPFYQVQKGVMRVQPMSTLPTVNRGGRGPCPCFGPWSGRWRETARKANPRGLASCQMAPRRCIPVALISVEGMERACPLLFTSRGSLPCPRHTPPPSLAPQELVPRVPVCGMPWKLGRSGPLVPRRGATRDAG